MPSWAGSYIERGGWEHPGLGWEVTRAKDDDSEREAWAQDRQRREYQDKTRCRWSRRRRAPNRVGILGMTR